MGILNLIGQIFALVMFILTSKKGADEETKKKREELADEAKKAIFSGDRTAIDRVHAKLRR